VYGQLGHDLILDECHALKTTDALRTRAIFGGGRKQPFDHRWLADKTNRVLGLTGTPLLNRPREAYTLAKALAFDSIDWATYDEFCYRFNPSQRFGFHIEEQQGRLPELQARMRCNFMVRRQKEDVLKDLPDKRYELVYIEPNGEIKDVLTRERLLHFNVEDLKNPFAEIWGQVSTVRREMGIAKVPRVVEHIKYLLDLIGLEKVVIFSHHKTVMDMLAQELAAYGVVQVRGGMGTTRQQESVDRFINDPKVKIFSGQLEAAGFGIDGLQKVCSHVVFAEPAWTPGSNEQAGDRCHRIGQHSNVVMEFLVVEGSLDERVMGKMFEKVHVIHSSLDKRLAA
jgi:SWI/SNF-related matrix-associated actin-dependent regulator 1 of chromatin subfamily A